MARSDIEKKWEVVEAAGEPKNFLAHMALEGGGMLGFVAAFIANVTGGLDYRYTVVSKSDGRRLRVRSRNRFEPGDVITSKQWHSEEPAP